MTIEEFLDAFETEIIFSEDRGHWTLIDGKIRFVTPPTSSPGECPISFMHGRSVVHFHEVAEALGLSRHDTYVLVDAADLWLRDQYSERRAELRRRLLALTGLRERN
jgi:hypothetical protein